ncbi:hypothetical protein OV079_49325 [Nannocystis pusilla]|uniref:Uncharacterized protein n=1 Tax=Nannocystis pusilla TaxID=889268 RepID=A0A9X3EZX1_9BACT|nr:hypothetical protein [Nannocystis pusilla]MCY1013402.1 hypothetical protein [Nannocystis pusilla]
MITLGSTIGALLTIVVRVLLTAGPAGPTTPAIASEPIVDLTPTPEPPQAPIHNGVAQPSRPTVQPDEPPLVDLETALDRAGEPLRACAREPGQLVSIELAVEAGATRFTRIDVRTTETTADRCVRGILERLRFAARPSASAFITELTASSSPR